MPAGMRTCRAEGRRPLYRRRPQGPAEIGDPRPEPGHLPRARAGLRRELSGAGRPRVPRADRQGAHRPRRRARHDHRLLAHGEARACRPPRSWKRPAFRPRSIDLRSLRPFDVETVVASVKKTNRIVSVEEGWPFAGIGSEIAAIDDGGCFDWLDAPPKRVAGKDVPLPYAANLERLAVPQVEDIVAAAREVAYR